MPEIFVSIFSLHQAATKLKQTSSLLAACLMLISLLARSFNPEDIGDMFLRNIDWLSNACTELYTRRQSTSLPELRVPKFLQTLNWSVIWTRLTCWWNIKQGKCFHSFVFNFQGFIYPVATNCWIIQQAYAITSRRIVNRNLETNVTVFATSHVVARKYAHIQLHSCHTWTKLSHINTNDTSRDSNIWLRSY